MRIRIAVIICVLFILTGCKSNGASLNKAIDLRNRLLNSNGCSFQTTVTADYGDKVYVFKMDCQADKSGNLTFSVIEPGTIAGITGKITGTGGSITFDEQVLAFQTIADGQITPVTAPWHFIKTLRSGYLRDISDTDDGYEITIDDSYEEESLQLRIRTKGQSPASAEIFWKCRRILTLTVENFTIL